MKNKEGKVLTSLDLAIEKYQVRSINSIIWYICKYQNSLVSSYLFQDKFSKLLSMGVDTDIILNSNVIFEKFDFDEWPSSHVNDKKIIAPYNGSVY